MLKKFFYNSIIKFIKSLRLQTSLFKTKQYKPQDSGKWFKWRQRYK